jgi:hypothetical protein
VGCRLGHNTMNSAHGAQANQPTHYTQSYKDICYNSTNADTQHHGGNSVLKNAH